MSTEQPTPAETAPSVGLRSTGAKRKPRRNYVRGHWGTPKSRSDERSVPLATRVATELKRHQQQSRFCADNDLVFAHPLTGQVLDHSS